MLLSDHISNYINLTGELPGDRPELLADLEAAMDLDCSQLARRLTVL
ncbi:MAG: hypothetical protein JRI95_05325 [Deltaproteobacteria bacterium]|nr:hypothetical protein [Deltaproteobacteria bacterium]MBW2085520.1 hypothetical protein [Deltaproteobacteria bacterium]